MPESYTIQTCEDRKTGVWMAHVTDDTGKTVKVFPFDLAIDAGTDVSGLINEAVWECGLPKPDWTEHDKEHVFFGYEPESSQ
jgi:hypothetical protein